MTLFYKSSPTRSLLDKDELALRAMTAVLMTAAAALALIGAEVCSGSWPDPVLLALLY